MQTWRVLRLSFSDPILLIYPSNPCYLPSMKCVGRTLGLTALHVHKVHVHVVRAVIACEETMCIVSEVVNVSKFVHKGLWDTTMSEYPYPA